MYIYCVDVHVLLLTMYMYMYILYNVIHVPSLVQHRDEAEEVGQP